MRSRGSLRQLGWRCHYGYHMSVLWITVLLSALLAFIFIALFVRDQARSSTQSRTGPEHAALLPLQEPTERRRENGTGVPAARSAEANTNTRRSGR